MNFRRYIEPLTLDALPEGALLLMDTAPIVHFLESHPKLGKIFKPLFERADGRYRSECRPPACDVAPEAAGCGAGGERNRHQRRRADHS
jgi:hypothetical protein